MISQERVGDIIHEMLDIVSSQPNGFPNVSMLSRSVVTCLSHTLFWTEFGEILLYLTVS
jgi:hypothetical protein